jgi:hypothetical protein
MKQVCGESQAHLCRSVNVADENMSLLAARDPPFLRVSSLQKKMRKQGLQARRIVNVEEEVDMGVDRLDLAGEEAN